MPDRLAEAKQEHEATQQRMGECYGPSHCITCWLIAKVERMEEAWDALPRSEAVDQLIASRDEVKRLEVALVVRDVKNDRLRADGIEAAVVIVERQLWIQPNNREILIAKIRATAHDKPEADANNADFRDGGYGKEPI